jgi:hypothetical protein
MPALLTSGRFFARFGGAGLWIALPRMNPLEFVVSTATMAAMLSLGVFIGRCTCTAPLAGPFGWSIW